VSFPTAKHKEMDGQDTDVNIAARSDMDRSLWPFDTAPVFGSIGTATDGWLAPQPTARHTVVDGQARSNRMPLWVTFWTLCPRRIAPVAGLSGTATPADLLEFSPTATQRFAKGQATPSSPTPPVPGMVWTLWPLEMAPVAGLRGTATPDPLELCPTARHRFLDAHATPDMTVPDMTWSS
jgi:hypothetical protein